MLDGIPRTFASPEIPASDFPEENEVPSRGAAKERLRKHGRTIEVDGVRVIVDGGWGLVRASNTQPLLVLRWRATERGELARDPAADRRNGAGNPGELAWSRRGPEAC